MMQYVPVVGSTGQPLMPCHPARARELVHNGRAVRRFNRGIFYIRLLDRAHGETQPIACGVDPGSKQEGYTVKSGKRTFLNIQAVAITWVRKAVEVRRNMRRSRRFRKLPYRKPRFNRAHGTLPPSTKARWQWKLRVCRWLVHLYPISVFVVEDIRARTRGQRRWDASFSPLELAKSAVGGDLPDNKCLLGVTPLRFHRRQLHRFQPGKGGIRRRYGGTQSLGLKRGSWVKHPKWDICYVGGTVGNRISLHSLETGKRLTQKAKPEDCVLLTYSSWRIRLLPGMNSAVSAVQNL
ncbi:MAG: RRXRR domain-containing protein [Candidatus Bipolaricaulia bacterium]